MKIDDRQGESREWVEQLTEGRAAQKKKNRPEIACKAIESIRVYLFLQETETPCRA